MPSDDSLMNRFDRNGLRRFRARDGVIALLVCAAVLVVFKGDSLERQGERMDPGFTRDVVLAVGHPAADVADALPFARATDDATAFLSPDDQLSADGGFATVAAGTGAEVPPVTPDAFEPQALGEKPPARKALKTLLVTGDSMVQPLDAKLAGALADRGVKVTREAKLGTGISKTFLVDWGQLSTQQVKQGQAGRRGGVHRRQRGLPDEGRGRARGRLLRRGLGGAVRQPRAPDGRHLPPERPREGLLDHRPRRPRREPGADHPRGQRGRARRRAAVGEPGPRDRHEADLRSQGLSRFNDRRRARPHRSRP